MIMMKVMAEIQPSKQTEFLQAVRSLITAQERQEGLRKLTLYREVDNPDGFCLIYEWNAQKDMDRYLGEEEFRVLLGALKVLGEKSEISLAVCRYIGKFE